MTVLAFARSQDYGPGENLRGGQEDAAWPYLLRSLDAGTIALVGRPRPATVAALGPVRGERRVVVDPAALDPSCGLVAVGADAADALSRDEAALGALAGVLDAGGAVYLEAGSAVPAAARRIAAALGVASTLEIGGEPAPMQAIDGRARRAWLLPPATPGAERARPAARTVRRVLGKAGRLLGRAAPEPAAGAPLRIGGATPRPPAPTPDRPLLLRDDHDAALLPAYVREAAGARQDELGAAGWTLAPLRGYRSQKAVFATPAGAIVKVTQDPRFNARLENEYRGLVALERRDLLDAALAPRPLFCGRHAGLVVVGETAVPGVPFRRRSDSTPACPVARSALDTLTDLAIGGADAEAGSPRAMAEAFADLLALHERVHAPPAAQRDALRAHIDALERTPGPLPAVFVHGDPSTLNLLVGDDGRVGLVDWENAESHGPPLWDVLYFVNALASWHAGRRGRRWTPRAVESTLFGSSGFHDLLAGAIGRQRAALGLAGEHVLPLVLFFWLAFAMRESTRLPAGRRGPYAATLERLVAAGDTPGLRALAGAPR